MRRSFLKPTIYFLLMAVAVFFLYRNFNQYLQRPNPLDTNVNIRNVYVSYTDKQDNVYLIDSSKQRISKIRSNGELEFSIFVEKDHRALLNGYLFIFSELAVGDDNSVYAKKTVIDPGGYYVLEESIIKYDSKGTQLSIILSKKYTSEDKNAKPGRIRSIKYQEGSLYYFEVKEDTIEFNKLPLEGKDKGSQTQVFPFDHSLYLSKLTGIYPDKVFFTTKKGEIYAAQPSGTHKKIFPPNEEESYSSPVYLSVDGSGKVYFADESQRRICLIAPLDSNKVDCILTEEAFQKKLSKDHLMIIKHLSVRDDGTLTAVINDNTYVKSPKGEFYHVKYPRKYPLKQYLINLSIWLWPSIIGLLLILGFAFLYRSFLRKRIETKQVSILMVIMAFTMSIASMIAFQQCRSLFTDQVGKKLAAQIHIATSQLDVSRFKSIKKPSHFMEEDYRELQNYIHVMQGHLSPHGKESAAKEKMDGFYSVMYKIEKVDGKNIFYICVTDDNYDSIFYPYLPADEDRAWYDGLVSESVGDDAIHFFEDSQDADGAWTFIMKPILDSDKNVIGLYEMGMNRNIVISYEKRILLYIVLANFSIAIVCVMLIWIFTRLLLKPLQLLEESVEQVAGGNLGTSLSIKSGDEIESLGNSFNNMSEKLQAQFMEIQHTNRAYECFVPKEFKEFLRDEQHPKGKSITDIRLGDQSDYEMTIMYSNICSFYSLAKEMTSTQSFAFINSFLNAVGPIIPKNHGFINSYRGSGIMALFPIRPYDAVNSAIGMRSSLKRYNQEYSKINNKDVDIAIAIHYCPVILGIIGEKNHMEGTVISEGVILTEALEKITGRLGASILATESTMKHLDNRQNFQYRYLGLISLESYKEPVAIYDLFQGDEESIRKAKEDSKEDFEEGILLYSEKRFHEARSRFVDVIKVNNKDEAAKIYFFRCDECLQNELPKDWDGSIHI